MLHRNIETFKDFFFFTLIRPVGSKYIIQLDYLSINLCLLIYPSILTCTWLVGGREVIAPIDCDWIMAKSDFISVFLIVHWKKIIALKRYDALL